MWNLNPVLAKCLDHLDRLGVESAVLQYFSAQNEPPHSFVRALELCPYASVLKWVPLVIIH